MDEAGGAGAAGPVKNHDPTVVGVAIAGIVSVIVSEDDWDLYDSLVGVALILVLLAYGRFRREVVASPWEAVAVGGVWSFCLLLVFGLVIDEFQGWFGWPPFAAANRDLEGFWFCVVWLIGTAVFGAALWLAGERLVHRGGRRGDGG